MTDQTLTSPLVPPASGRPAARGAERRGRGARLQRAGRARAQHPQAAPLPGRRAAVLLADRHRRQREHRRDARHRRGARARAARVEVLRLERKGRGLALREAWSRSDARVLCYMDVDLSTDLRGLLPLVAPLLSGHSDVAIGTRLARSARVVRGLKRELISRSYNRLLRTVLRARFSDAQCGFKAVTATAARRLLGEVRDDGWFFDTELLVLAQRSGPAHPRGPRGLGRRPRLARRHRAHRDRGPARRRAPGGGGPRRALHGRRRAQHDRLRRALPAAARDARRRRGERRRPRADRGGQHGRQPAPDLRRARTRAAPAPSRARSRRLRPHAGADDARAGQPASHRSARRRARSSWRCSSSRARRRPSPATWPCARGSSPARGRPGRPPPKRPC